MIRVHYANRLENLIAPLAGALAKQQRLLPLERITIVVPSRVIEGFLKHRLAEAIGVAANLEFPFLRKFLARIIQTADPTARILEAEELELVLFEGLRAAVRNNSREVASVRNYIEAGSATEADRELRAYHLARRVAWLFREYSITRQSMLRGWMRNSHLPDEQGSDVGHWQRHLWLSTFDANGYLRREWKNSAEYSWMLLPAAFDRVSDDSIRTALPPVVHVFGLAYTGPAYARIFARIGKLKELELYALNPCLEFWEDLEQLSGVGRQSWARRQQKIGASLEDSGDPFGLDAAGDTPALRLWGRPGREHIRLLNELTECDFDPHFTHHDESNSLSLLGSLQESILIREPERELQADREYLGDDGSLRFLGCPGVTREAEIVANEIWSMIDRDKRGRDAIRFHQVAVIVPDSLYEDYLPHLEAAFERQHQLPMSIVNRSFAGAGGVREAISLLLRLPLGRFSRDEMLRLLSHPAIGENDPANSSDDWDKWCEALGIFFGADEDDLASTYIPRDLYHWNQGLRRLGLGVFMRPDRDTPARFFTSLDNIDYLPFETAPDEIGAVLRFIKTARTILSDAIELRSCDLPLGDWSRLLSNLILRHIHTTDSDDERIREHCISVVESIAISDLKSTPVSYQTAFETVSARILNVESQLGQFTEHGIAIGPLSALRAIPFRAIFLLGLNENQFPERTREDPMDLRLAKRAAGDVTSSERDRYLFLETILAARERLYLCYTARDAKTGNQLEPSSVVRELQFILRGYVTEKTLTTLTIEHPLSRYDPRYFPDTDESQTQRAGALISFDRQARHAAQMAALRRDLARHCGDVPLPGRDEPILEQLGPEARKMMRRALGMLEIPRSAESKAGASAEITLPITALRKFLECPIQGAAQYALGIFEDEGDGGEQWQDEPVAQSILDRTVMLREVFWKARGNPAIMASEFCDAFKVSQIQGHAPAGSFAQAAQRADIQSLEKWIAESSRAGAHVDQWREIRLGRTDQAAHADQILPELSLSVDVPGLGGQPRRVLIYGNAGFLSPALDASIRLVLRDKAKPKDYLAPFLAALVLTAAERMTTGTFRAIVVGAGRDKSWNETKILQCPSADQAKSYLSTLVADLLFGKNHYFLPIEAVEDVFGAIGKARRFDSSDIIDDLRDNEFKKCSSDYGPIRDARRFDPPNPRDLQQIMERRFGLIRAIFTKQES